MKTECVINNTRYEYDVCDTLGNLKLAELFYGKNYIYFGSNNGLIYFNNKLHNLNKLLHFFVKNTKSNRNMIRKEKLKKIKFNESW